MVIKIQLYKASHKDDLPTLKVIGIPAGSPAQSVAPGAESTSKSLKSIFLLRSHFLTEVRIPYSRK